METIDQLMAAVGRYDFRLLMYKGESTDSYLRTHSAQWAHVIENHVNYLDELLTFEETAAQLNTIYMAHGYNNVTGYAGFHCCVQVVC